MSQTPIFREEALATLNSPEQLGHALKVVRPAYKWLVGLMAATILGGFAAAGFVKVPIMVQAPGVIVSSKGVLEIPVTAQYEGRVSELLVGLGDPVIPGQPVARLVQPALQNELHLAREERDGIDQELGRVRSLQQKVTTLVTHLQARQREGTEESVTMLNQRLQALEELARKQERMRTQGTITLDRYLQVRAEVADVRERLASKKNSILGIQVEQGEKQAQYDREIQTLETRRSQAERQIQRVEARIKEETVVRSLHHGTVMELAAMPGDLVRFDAPVVGLMPAGGGMAEHHGSQRLVAALLLPARDGKKVRQGMDVLVDPTSVRRDVYGAIEGVVATTSDVPATSEGLRRLLRNDELARRLGSGGASFLTTVELTMSDQTPSGYTWTTSRGPDMKLTLGTLLEAEVEVERVSLLSLMLPAIKGLLRGPAGQQTATQAVPS